MRSLSSHSECRLELRTESQSPVLLDPEIDPLLANDVTSSLTEPISGAWNVLGAVWSVEVVVAIAMLCCDVIAVAWSADDMLELKSDVFVLSEASIFD